MKKIWILSAVVFGVIFAASGCGFFKGWQMDYGKVKAQFEEVDVAEKGRSFIGKKVTVRGIVKRVDLTEKGNAKVFLTNGTECHFGKMEVMARGMEVGKVVYVDGFLEKCDSKRVLIKPAMARDPEAPFKP
ncbi:MAG: hypothetical protein P1U90_17880 [Akkermansiaceae bacterium]|nr:hypothetical protein [Akkermansiaceae bacterium]